MRDYPVLLVTLMADRLWGRAIASHLEALRHLRREYPAVSVDHIQSYGHPQLMTDGNHIVAWKYIQARKRFLDGDYATLITVEDDMVIPEDALTRLLSHLWEGADIVYGLYVFRHGMPATKWNAYTELDCKTGKPITFDKELARKMWGKTIDVVGVGQGCTAQTRASVEAIPYTVRGKASTDWYMAIDAQKLGLVQRCDLGLVCGHMTVEPSPRILWPDPEAKNLVRIEFLPNE